MECGVLYCYMCVFHISVCEYFICVNSIVRLKSCRACNTPYTVHFLNGTVCVNVVYYMQKMFLQSEL